MLLGDYKLAVLRDSDIFVLPSLYENFPLSLLEAMASECSVVASDVGGIPEVIADGINGILVSPTDQEELAEKIKMLADDKDYARSIAKRGRQTVVEKFSWDQTASDTYSYIEKVRSGT